MRYFWIFPAFLVAACSAATPGESQLASTPGPSASMTPAPPPADSSMSAPPVSSEQPPPPAASASASVSTPPPGPTHCPENMILVEGEYCTKVKQKCLKEWFDKSNKKHVCEKFAPRSRCIGKKVKKRFCIDKYSWPNIKGERPEVMNTYYQAQVKCAAVGKRMCTESEWTYACEGPEMKPFPYGYTRDANKCNGDHKWDHPRMKKVAKRDPKELARLWKGVRSGSQPECVSDFGVHDLPGNNDEVVASEHMSGSRKDKYFSVNTGGPWYRGVRNQCRPKIYTHDEGFYYYFLGFRCCAEPDGATTDPLSKKQHKKRWKFRRIERLAQFSKKEMQEKLKLKKEGKCVCKQRSKRKRILCKTMCGTLLGPNAKDAKMPHLALRLREQSKARPLRAGLFCAYD